ncbi:DinB family protein [Bhargavaea ginsengi]|nr:DinB family protein [Bhargavaea ginsengi]
MNETCSRIFHHLEWLSRTVIQMTSDLTVEDMDFRPDPKKRSLGELLSHIALICEADARISDEASEKEMADYYQSAEVNSPEEVRSSLRNNLKSLKQRYDEYTETDLNVTTTSWWGTTDTRLGWLVQILTHMAHHRGQLHSMLVRMGKDPEIQLFE